MWFQRHERAIRFALGAVVLGVYLARPELRELPLVGVILFLLGARDALKADREARREDPTLVDSVLPPDDAAGMPGGSGHGLPDRDDVT